MNETAVTLQRVLFDSDIIDEFGCCKLIIDNEVIWDDNVDWSKYIKFTDALQRYFSANPNWNNYKVVDVNIQIVHFHHSIVSVRCEK